MMHVLLEAQLSVWQGSVSSDHNSFWVFGWPGRAHGLVGILMTFVHSQVFVSCPLDAACFPPHSNRSRSFPTTMARQLGSMWPCLDLQLTMKVFGMLTTGWQQLWTCLGADAEAQLRLAPQQQSPRQRARSSASRRRDASWKAAKWMDFPQQQLACRWVHLEACVLGWVRRRQGATAVEARGCPTPGDTRCWCLLHSKLSCKDTTCHGMRVSSSSACCKQQHACRNRLQASWDRKTDRPWHLSLRRMLCWLDKYAHTHHLPCAPAVCLQAGRLLPISAGSWTVMQARELLQELESDLCAP